MLRRRRVEDVPESIVAAEVSIYELSSFLRWAAAGVPSRTDLECVVASRDGEFDAGTGFEYVLRAAGRSSAVRVHFAPGGALDFPPCRRPFPGV